MSKSFVDILVNDTRLNTVINVIEELYEENKSVRVVIQRPPKPTGDELELAKNGALVQTEVDDIEYVINPITKKWDKKFTGVGKLIIALCNK